MFEKKTKTSLWDYGHASGWAKPNMKMTWSREADDKREMLSEDGTIS